MRAQPLANLRLPGSFGHISAPSEVRIRFDYQSPIIRREPRKCQIHRHFQFPGMPPTPPALRPGLFALPRPEAAPQSARTSPAAGATCPVTNRSIRRQRPHSLSMRKLGLGASCRAPSPPPPRKFPSPQGRKCHLLAPRRRRRADGRTAYFLLPFNKPCDIVKSTTGQGGTATVPPGTLGCLPNQGRTRIQTQLNARYR